MLFALSAEPDWIFITDTNSVLNTLVLCELSNITSIFPLTSALCVHSVPITANWKGQGNALVD